ncbi:MAG TPA: hypothetical protein VKV77_01845 [Methylovirgula sp.]|nr:hypothetical protein [Methylovirgula sp.]
MSSGFLLVMVAIALVGVDCWHWLGGGSFEPISLWTYWHALGMSQPVFESQGVQFAAVGFLHFPISLALAIMGLLLIKRRQA